MDQFLSSYQNFAQNSTRNSKIMVSKILVKKWHKNCSVHGLKIYFWIQCFYKIFWHVSWIQKSHSIWMRLKVEVKSPLSVLWRKKIFFSVTYEGRSNLFTSALSIYLSKSARKIKMTCIDFRNVKHNMILPKSSFWRTDYLSLSSLVVVYRTLIDQLLCSNCLKYSWLYNKRTPKTKV